MITILIRCAQSVMKQLILDVDANLLSGDAVLVFTYAKAYYKGGGWYAISGYAHDGSDVHKVIKMAKEIRDYERTPIEDFVF